MMNSQVNNKLQMQSTKEFAARPGVLLRDGESVSCPVYFAAGQRNEKDKINSFLKRFGIWSLSL